MTELSFDRRLGDVGNVVLLEHVNVFVPDLERAALFYVNALGFTRDPFVDLGPSLLWINLGRQQFHLPKGAAQVLRGTIEVVVPDLAGLERRLEAAAPHLAGSAFDYEVGDDRIDVRGPWGNHIRCRRSSVGDPIRLGMVAVEFPVAEGSADGIARFYQRILGAPATVDAGGAARAGGAADGPVCEVAVGPGQVLRFRESADPIAPYDGHHLAVYVADFSGPHGRLLDRDLIVEESSAHQYRFNWIVDPDTGERLFEVEHEVRSLHHPLYLRPLANRNPDQNLMDYVPGADAFTPPGAGSRGPADRVTGRPVPVR